MKNTGWATLIACAWIACADAHAPVANTPLPSSAPAAPAIAESTGCCRIVAGTVVDLEIMEPINSFKQHRGDNFALRLAESVAVDGRVVIPAGTPGVGQIVHAQAAHSGGAAGELILAARHLDYAGQQLPLRGLKLGATGKDNTGLALGVTIAAGPFAMFIRGREIEIPAGTRVNAKLAQDFVIPSAPVAPPLLVAISQQEH